MADEQPVLRLSSDYLYHFKKDPGVLRLILRHGFRHSSWQETLPFFDIKQHTFTVCFCDIRPQDTADHRRCYGQNAIALTKDWGVRNDISPVRYVHRTSPGATQDYITQKTFYRSVRKLADAQPDKALLHYLVHCVLDEAGHLIDGDLEKTVAVSGRTRGLAQQAQQRISKTLNDAAAAGVADDVVHLLDLLMDRIHALHNELEKRDSFMRAYTEDFKSPATGQVIKDKILYDEREWRSIKFLDLSKTLQNPGLREESESQKFLQPDYNLKFEDSDVVGVLAQDAAARAMFIEEISSGETLLSPGMASKVFIFADFTE
jgi:hypothetical protein